MMRHVLRVVVMGVVSGGLIAVAAEPDRKQVIMRLDGSATASDQAASPVAATRSGLAPGSTVIELRCGWQRSGYGTDDLIGSCKPPPCPAGWTDLGPTSCGANGIECVEACLAVGDCSRFCSN
jgi:hypothetical protein